MADQREIGTLVVVVLKARNLKDDHFYKQDVYAQVSLSGKQQQTKTDVKGGQHPLWDDELRFPVYRDSGGKSRKLEVACYSKESRKDVCIGQGELDISETLQTGEFDDWIKFETNNQYRGEIYLEMTYFATGPAPVQRRPSKLHPNERMYRVPHATPPKTPPKGHSPGASPRYGQANLAASTSPTGGHLAPPHSPPKTNDVPLPAIPPLLRPGNLSSTPQPLQPSKPLPPDHPAHATARLSAASPPISASAYPPAHAAPVYPAPPAALQPGPGRGYGRGHTNEGGAGEPSFSMPMPEPGPIYDDNYNYVGLPEPTLPDPYAYRATAQTRAAFREDGLPTPRAAHQPQHAPAFPQRLREEPPPRHPAALQGHGVAVNRDAQTAQEMQRREEEQERRRKAQEEEDLRLAMELDREFNAPPEGAAAHMPGEW